MFSHEQFAELFCMYCDKSFTIEAEWRRHERGHTAIRNYECIDCGKAFIDSQTLNEHVVC